VTAPFIDSFRADGSVMNLAALEPSDIDFATMANALAKNTRYAGVYSKRYPMAIYSIAQHCVVGADVLFKETGDRVLAGYFLLHDGHEYIIGDITSPTGKFLDFIQAAQQRPYPQNGADDALSVTAIIDLAKATLDAIIHQSACLPPLKSMPLYARKILEMNDRMLRAEGLLLFGQHAGKYLPKAKPLPANALAELHPWGSLPSDPKKTGDKKGYAIAKAEFAFVDRLERYLNIIARPA